MSESNRWTAEFPYPGNPSPRASTPRAPENLRGRVVLEAVRGHVVNGRTVQADSGRRYLAVVPGDQRPGDRISFQVVADPAHGSRLEAAVNILAVAE
jgi:hypothetical protein